MIEARSTVDDAVGFICRYEWVEGTSETRPFGGCLVVGVVEDIESRNGLRTVELLT